MEASRDVRPVRLQPQDRRHRGSGPPRRPSRRRIQPRRPSGRRIEPSAPEHRLGSQAEATEESCFVSAIDAAPRAGLQRASWVASSTPSTLSSSG